MKNLIKITAVILTLAFFASLAFSCTKPAEEEDRTPQNPEEEIDIPAKEENTILGQEGNIKFDLVVVHKDKSEVLYKVETTKDTLEGALLEGSIGLKQKTDDGFVFVEIDEEKLEDGAHWAFYKEGVLLTENPADIAIDNGDNFRAVYTAE